MSRETPHFTADARGLKFAVVVARFNSGITEKLLEGAREALAKAGADGIEVFHVPGAFELPLAAKWLAHGGYSAIIALGAVIRGETPHFDFVAGEAARGLQQVALECSIPVAFGVLTTDTLEQAEARAGGKHGNKGHDAAMTAIEMARFGHAPGKAAGK
ncbi:MAG TPA: 6,7-dimethyl-8-ribityllumazine synthase [Bryobacteraceae bacterium]|jgi:6,7-dimethyl-8-ribityllumazine synthase|nr:6,7-dimethyl-8-ribityllumazine synthase [Bryobacteraceae bacterium]